jgi:hypothetical protein
MTTFEKRSDATNYDDRDSHHGRDSQQQQQQQRAGLATAENMMSTWTVAFYDYLEQVLKAQRQFAHSMLGAAAPMLDVARDITFPDANQGSRSANSQMDARGGQRHDGSDRSWKNERYNDDETAEYNNRSTDDNTSNDTSDTSRIERANTQAEQSAKTRSPVAVSATARKRP